MYRERIRQRTDTIDEIALDVVLQQMTRYCTLYQPRIALTGEENLPAADAGQATLAISAHTMLSAFILRVWHDRGLRATAIAADPALRVPGTRVPAPVLVPTPRLLITVRELFAAGEYVCSMIDRADVERRTRPVKTAQGEIIVSTALLELAVRMGVRIVFLTATSRGSREIDMTLYAPPTERTTSVTDVLEEFGRFLDAHAPVNGGRAPRSRDPESSAPGPRPDSRSRCG